MGRRGLDRSGQGDLVWRGSKGGVRTGGVGCGPVGSEWRGSRGGVRSGAGDVARRGRAAKAWVFVAGQHWLGRHGRSGLEGKAGQHWLGVARYGMEWRGDVRQQWRGLARKLGLGPEGRAALEREVSEAWQGWVRRGSTGVLGWGPVGSGPVRLGSAG